MSPRLRDARWLQARDEDPLEKVRLAQAVGAVGLLAGVDDGGETGDTALAALPFADDGDVALDHLAALARTDGARRRRILVAILGIVGQPRRQREPLDLEGARRAGEVLVGLVADASLPREERALALSAARALAERGLLAPGRVPADLVSPPPAL
jgi:hypothetical protein